MKITTVIVSYWPDRFANLPEIVIEVNRNKPRPSSVIVFNNNPKHKVPSIPGATVINSETNYTSRSKYGIALLEPSNYYLLLDDDVSIQPEFIEHCLKFAHPNCCYSDQGGKMQSNLASEATEIDSSKISWPEPADLFQGSVQFLSFNAIVRMLQAESQCRLSNLPEYSSVAEDILIAMANRSACVIPINEKTKVTHNRRVSKAMEFDEGYYQIRDIFAYHAWITLGNKPFQDHPPLLGEHGKRQVKDYFRTLKRRDRQI